MKPAKLLRKVRRKPDTTSNLEPAINPEVFGPKLGLISRLVGCSHREVGRPFVQGNTAYRSCLKCGARRQFDPGTFETFGNFYGSPVGHPRQ